MRERRLAYLGHLSDLPEGIARVVPCAGVPPRASILVVRSAVGVRAYWNVCQHLPVPLDAEGEPLDIREALVCRSHGARYTLEDGLCYSGPCRGKWLEPVALKIEGDDLYADLSP